VPREDVIRLLAQVVEVLSERLCRVELSNGHRMLAYVGGRHRSLALLKSVRPGGRITIEVSPFDFSKGRIVAEEQVNNF